MPKKMIYDEIVYPDNKREKIAPADGIAYELGELEKILGPTPQFTMTKDLHMLAFNDVEGELNIYASAMINDFADPEQTEGHPVLGPAMIIMPSRIKPYYGPIEEEGGENGDRTED